MSRISRIESQAQTREKLLAAAATLFGRDGYAVTSLERIAQEAGFSKGAIYSNFDGKEAIFLQVLEQQGTAGLDGVIATISAADTPQLLRKALRHWANERSCHGLWTLTILEHARSAGPGSPSVLRQEAVLRSHWRRLGEAVLLRLPALDQTAETLGALLHEIAYAPAPTFMREPSAGTLMDVVVAMLLEKGAFHPAAA